MKYKTELTLLKIISKIILTRNDPNEEILLLLIDEVINNLNERKNKQWGNQ